MHLCLADIVFLVIAPQSGASQGYRIIRACIRGGHDAQPTYKYLVEMTVKLVEYSRGGKDLNHAH